MKKKKYRIEEDLEKYPKFVYINKQLIPIEHIERWPSSMQAHHFVRQTTREHNPKFYKRVEHLQKIIFVPYALNYHLEWAGEDFILKEYGLPKNDLVFSRKAWREGYYD